MPNPQTKNGYWGGNVPLVLIISETDDDKRQNDGTHI